MQVIQHDMERYFSYHSGDNAAQQALRSYYFSLYCNIDGMDTPCAGAEKAVAKRKLMESMDAAMRALTI